MLAIHDTVATRLAWKAERNGALYAGAPLPGWEAHVHFFTPKNPELPCLGGEISGTAIIVGSDCEAVRNAALECPATSRQLFQHGVDLLYRGEIL